MSNHDQEPNNDNEPQDQSGLGGNTTGPTDKEKKVAFLEDVLRAQVAQDLAAQKADFISIVGGERKAKDVDFWAAVRKNEASEGRRLTHGPILRFAPELSSKSIEERDPYERIVAEVALDLDGRISQNEPFVRPPDVTSFNSGRELAEMARSGQISTPEDLEKAKKTLSLLVAVGLYKLGEWGNGDQLETATSLIETFAAEIPGFSPSDALGNEAGSSLTRSLAALEIDDETKPNWQYANPERKHRFETIKRSLDNINRAEAYVYLAAHEDFEIPPGFE